MEPSSVITSLIRPLPVTLHIVHFVAQFGIIEFDYRAQDRAGEGRIDQYHCRGIIISFVQVFR